MDKQEIISILQQARVSHDILLNDGQVLIDGINLDKVEEPIKCDDCQFSHWYVEHESKISAFTWFQELKETHINLHNKFSVLFFESMRKYSPKTLDQLLVRFEALKSEADLFNAKLDEVEEELEHMPDTEFSKFVSSQPTTDDNSFQKIDIEEYEDALVVDEQLELVKELDEENVKHTSAHSSNSEEGNSSDTNGQEPVSAELTISDMGIPKNNLSDTKNYSKNQSVSNKNPESADIHITLKERNIVQLQQEKELSQLELVHLENTQKLNVQSAEQLEQSFILKLKEIEIDKNDNDNLLAFKNNTRKDALTGLNEITDTERNLKNLIEDLQMKSEEAQLKQERDISNISITKQFKDLKHNKNKDLNTLLQHLELRKVDLQQLKSQLLLVEEEIADMEMEKLKKQQDMSDLEAKEHVKMEQNNQQLAEQQKLEDERQNSINARQKELDVFLKLDRQKQRDLESIDFEIQELQKNNKLSDKASSNELEDLQQQHQERDDKVEEIDRLKESKQAEINEIDKNIEKAERSLAKLKSSQGAEEQKLTTAH